MFGAVFVGCPLFGCLSKSAAYFAAHTVFVMGRTQERLVGKVMKANQRVDGDLHGLFMSCALSSDHQVRTWRRAIPSLKCRREAEADEEEEIDLVFFA